MIMKCNIFHYFNVVLFIFEPESGYCLPATILPSGRMRREKDTFKMSGSHLRVEYSIFLLPNLTNLSLS